MSERKGDFMVCATGTEFWPLDPRLEEIHIEDIARSLSKQCRYAGHTITHYSIAEHCVHLSYYVPPKDALWALMHDASEAYLVDVPKPVKRFLRGYIEIEANLMRFICKRFNLPLLQPASVSEADIRICANERAALLPETERDWNVGEPLSGIHIQGWDHITAYVHFMARFKELTGKTE